MKYIIETTETGCVETLELNDGRKYVKRHTRTALGLRGEDQDFAVQMKEDGISDELLEAVDENFDGFLAIYFVEMSELDC